ncbi:MAG: ATP-binding cassette domain-containing protein [Lachnospiraceae bacterium]
MEKDIIKVSKLTKTYKEKTVLDHVSMVLKSGQICGLVGNNGAGKTTLMRMITGTAFWDTGTVELFGEEQTEKTRGTCKRIGALLEQPSFFENMTGRQNLEYYRIQFGIPGKECVEQLMIQTGLQETERKKVKAYSMGMKQRLGIALALLNHPDVLVLDEPINGLDPRGIIEIRNILLKLNQEQGITVLISSHILAELTNIATHFCFMNQGRVLEEISKENLKQKCQTYLEIKVTDEAKMSVLLEKKMPEISYRIYPQKIIRIFGGIDQSQKISELAVKNGIGLLGLTTKAMNLENYYMHLIGNEEMEWGEQ